MPYLLSDTSITTDMFNYSLKPALGAKLNLFHRYGFRYIHWCDDWREENCYSKSAMEEFRRLVDSSGLRCMDVHSAETDVVHICAEDDEDLERYIRLLENRIEFCSLIGGDAVVIHPPNDAKGARSLGWKIDRTFHVFESVRPLCEKSGVALAVENCYPTDGKVLGCYFAKYSPEFIGLCLDSGHANINNNLEKVLRFGNRVKVLHLHDNKGAADDHQPPYWGTIDWKRLMRWIAQSGYSKPVNFEITHRPELFEGSMEDYLDFVTRSIAKAMALVTR